LTQEQLAQQAGCAVGTIKKLEGDDRRPSRQMAERLADLLQIDSEERTAFLKAARAELATDQLVVANVPLDLLTDFPSLATIDQPMTNLPIQTTAFIGREHEVAVVHDLLRRTDMRLVTLTGPGGTGKKRLRGLGVITEATPERAQALLEESLALCQGLGDAWRSAIALHAQ
jgi:transcriptional regulator with XRE-family HTH domain